MILICFSLFTKLCKNQIQDALDSAKTKHFSVLFNLTKTLIQSYLSKLKQKRISIRLSLLRDFAKIKTKTP
jgi:hypothetical protein